MSQRLTRSRSKTPFDDNTQEITRITRSTTYKKINEESSSTTTMKASKSKLMQRRSHQMTSDYSSEDNDNEVTSSEEQNMRNERIVEQESGAALKIYREAEQYWNLYPKTDYTYSRYSKDRIEIAPGIVNMPNMSRKSIHTSDYINKETNTNLEDISTATTTTTNNNKYESFTYTRSEWKSIGWFIECVNSFTIYVLKHLHKTASRVMLADTWLLKSNWKDSLNKYRLLPLLCLLCLLIFGGLWFLSNILPVIQQNNTKLSTNEENLIRIQLIDGNLNELTDRQLAASIKSQLKLNVDEELILNAIRNYKMEPTTTQFNLHDEQMQFHHEISKMKQLQDESFGNLKETNAKLINELEMKVNEMNFDLNRFKMELRDEYKRKSLMFMQELKKCCRHSFLQIERYVSLLMNDPEFISTWLSSVFVAKEELDTKLNNLSVNLNDQLRRLFDDNEAVLMHKVSERLSVDMKRSGNVEVMHTSGVDTDLIKRIVKDVLSVYDADKTGLVDYALETAGGQIISIRCTDIYSAGSAVYSFLGIPIWYPTHGPRTVITSGSLTPGVCWAFKNFPGYLVIQLSANITIDAFSYEHVSRSLVSTGRIDSAPKSFSVFGLHDEYDKEPTLIGDYLYDSLGDSLQFFTAQTENAIFNMIELRIDSNHGNPHYTCLYRFRVHGKLIQKLVPDDDG